MPKPSPLAEITALLPYAYPDQAVKLQAVLDNGSIRKASAALGLNFTSVHATIDVVRRRAATLGHSPAHDMTRTVPDGFVVKGVSTFYNKEGKAAGQWVKSRLEESAARQALQIAIAELAKATPRAKPLAKPKGQQAAELCNLYTLTDCHVGMRAWGRETGADWDLKIAEQTLVDAVRHMIAAAPPAETGIVAQLGDWLHFDSLSAITPTSGHILDADSRFGMVVEVSIRILRDIIDLALQRHSKVVVLMAEGNHDMASAVWLRHVFKLLYEREPRVHVIDSELPYYVYQHGQTMLAWHHGHLAKLERLPQIIAAEFAPVWGATTRRYCHTGHMHHALEREHDGIDIIQHPTMAARDAYASRHGWQAKRQITAITYHVRHGQVARHTVTPEMLTH